MIDVKITASCPTNMPSKYYIKRYKKQKTFKKCWANNFPKPTIEIRFLALSTRVIFVFDLLIYTFF